MENGDPNAASSICGKANRATGEGRGEAGPKVAAKLGVRTSVSADYPKPNRHRKNDKETLWDLASSRTNEVGPGLYDIHSPRVPSADEMIGLLKKALQVLPRKQVWVNPDCGLKTRGWPELQESLTNMVLAARKTRTAD
jgi:methionine synthase II (cobalamin-independent)